MREPDWSAAARDGGAPRPSTTSPTEVWLDRIAAIDSGSAGSNTMSLADHLDEAAQQDAANESAPLVFQVVIYNLPGRDCAALASNGELGRTSCPATRTSTSPRSCAGRSMRIVAVIEIDSLPNLITNVSGNRERPRCPERFSGCRKAMALLPAQAR